MSIRMGRRTGKGTWVTGNPLEMICASLIESVIDSRQQSCEANTTKVVTKKGPSGAEVAAARKARLAAHDEAMRTGGKSPYFS